MTGFLSRLLGQREPAVLDARAADAAALVALHAASFRHGWSESEFEQLLGDRSVLAQVARASGGRGRVVGFILSRLAADEAEILTVAVRSAERGRGVASALLARHLPRLASLGAKCVFLEVDEGNRAALKLYARAGFAEVGRRAGYYQGANSAAALVLRRDLA